MIRQVKRCLRSLVSFSSNDWERDYAAMLLGDLAEDERHSLQRRVTIMETVALIGAPQNAKHGHGMTCALLAGGHIRLPSLSTVRRSFPARRIFAELTNRNIL
jgi:hypothetical protein